MSATNRGETIRAPLDSYVTPDYAIDAIAPTISNLLPGGSDRRVLDPSLGAGAIVRRLRHAQVGGMFKRSHFYGFEIDRGRATESFSQNIVTVHCDALRLKEGEWQQPDGIVMNPPFGLAMEFMVRALKEVKRNGVVAVLLRLNFLAGQKRAIFHRAHPCGIYVLPKRPSFTGGGQTDATDYAWFVYSPEFKHGQWSVLNLP